MADLSSALTPEAYDRIDRYCDEFETAWQSGKAPCIEDFLVQESDDAVRRALLKELLLREAELRGRPDPFRLLEEYQARFPQFFLDIEQWLLPKLDPLGTQKGDKVWDQETVTRKGSGPDDTDSSVPPLKKGGIFPRPKLFGPYELLAEIARGGMGVVYQAQQLQPNRIVALKMILSGQLASQEMVERFYAEADAAAHLDHPGIVPIYEVGQHENQHYFSMAYVEGVSLGEVVREHPLPSQAAAEILKRIAEAIAYAHERGVIHRDLKPANVLLAKVETPSRPQLASAVSLTINKMTGWYVPKVTDFGLAKRTDTDTELTGTGQVMGTPGYMPPEQARGATSRIGPHSDVYSLGATLYCILTGRPPFQAANLMDVLQQVLDREPVSPRDLNPEVDRDLETITLKCLEKDPERRYSSAQELNEELGRYLRGEPITARPVSRRERFWRWCKREPIVATLSSLVLLVLLVGISVSSYFAVENAKRVETERQLREQAKRDEEKATQLSQQYLTERDRADQKAAEAETAKTLAEQETQRANDNLETANLQRTIAEQQRDHAIRLQGFAGRLISNLFDLTDSIPREEMTVGQLSNFLELDRDLTSIVEEYEQELKNFKGEPDPSFYETYAQAMHQLAQLKEQVASSEEAAATYAKAKTLYVDLIKKFPETSQYRVDLANIYRREAMSHTLIGNFDKSEDLLQKSVDIFEKLLKDTDPEDPAAWEYQFDFSNSLNDLGALYIASLRYEQAETVLKKAIDIREQLLKEDHDFLAVDHKIAIAGAYLNLANLYDSQEQYAKSRKALQTGLDCLDSILPDELFGEYREHYHFTQAMLHNNYATLSLRTDELTTAKQEARKALSYADRLDMKVVHHQILKARCLRNLGYSSLISGETTEAEAALQQSLEIYQTLTPDQLNEVDIIADLGRVPCSLATIYLMQGKFSEAAEMSRIGTRQLDRIPEFFLETRQGHAYSTGHFVAAQALICIGEYEEALLHLDKLLAVGSTQEILRFSRMAKLICQAATGDYQKALYDLNVLLKEHQEKMTWPDWFGATQVEAVVATRALHDREDPLLNDEFRQQRSRRYALKAINRLNDMYDAEDLSVEEILQLKHSEVFVTLRTYPEFQELMDRLQSPQAQREDEPVEQEANPPRTLPKAVPDARSPR